MRVLAIESSCDETAAAVVDESGRVFADVVRSQVKLHAPYGGVVPELASRDHMRAVSLVVREALDRVGGFSSIDGIAATTRPGLAGALLVGVQAAKGIAWARDLPFVAVDHLVGHLLAAFLEREGTPTDKPEYPFIALLASGGHTAIYRVDGPELSQIKELGGTRDDAAGEAFDKIAKLLGLGYPGGPIVDRLAAKGRAENFPVPTPMARRDSLELSFSGLKTFVARALAERGIPEDEPGIADVCAGFQRAVVGSLVTKTLRAAKAEGIDTVVLAGGVAANRELRARAAAACEKAGKRLVVPAFASCTDNAAMIAYVGALRLARGERDDFSVPTATRTALLRVTRKGRGPR